jgi:hypothetical protein
MRMRGQGIRFSRGYAADDKVWAWIAIGLFAVAAAFEMARGVIDYFA